MLNIFKSHITENADKNIPVMPEINTSMHYVGDIGSYTSLHEEDSGLSSINLLKCSCPKIWHVVDHRFRADVEKNVEEHLEKCMPHKVICSQILKHKIYLVAPALLDKWKIPYTLLEQHPGDMFYIKKGTYHAVVNSGVNLAEAVNYGCDEWNGGYEPTVCGCDESKKCDIPQNRTVATTHKRLSKKLYECNENGCQHIFTSKKLLEHHKKFKHSIKTTFTCSDCSKMFALKSSLDRHLKQHVQKENTVQCTQCGSWVRSLSDHTRNVHSKKIKCLKCEKMINRKTLKKHIESCNVKCLSCKRLFTNKRYLTQHKKCCSKSEIK